jgi:hypothetical protein
MNRSGNRLSPSNCFQQAPHPGQPTPFKTQVKILVSEDALYFGFICHDPSPKAIAVHTQRRDGDVNLLSICQNS